MVGSCQLVRLPLRYSSTLCRGPLNSYRKHPSCCCQVIMKHLWKQFTLFFWIMLMGLFVAFMVARLESLTLLCSLVYWFGCLFWAQRGTAPSGFGCDIYPFILGMCVSHGIWNLTGWLPPFKNSWILGIDYNGKIFGHFTLLPSGYHKVMVRRACQEQLMSIHIPAWRCCPSRCPDHFAPLNLCHYVSWSCTKCCVSQCPRGALGDSQDG